MFDEIEPKPPTTRTVIQNHGFVSQLQQYTETKLSSLKLRHFWHQFLHRYPLNLKSLLLLYLCENFYPISAQSTTTQPPTNTDDYTSVYIAMIIIFSVLIVVVVFCVVFRIHNKKRKNDKPSYGDQKKQRNDNANAMDVKSINDSDDFVTLEQVKFRGSMSSVENRHERIPSKPVVIQITTPKGSQHVADAFGEYDGKEELKNAQNESELPNIAENREDEEKATDEMDAAADNVAAQPLQNSDNNQEYNEKDKIIDATVENENTAENNG